MHAVAPDTLAPQTLNHALLNELKITFGGQAVEFKDVRMEKLISPTEGGVQQRMRQGEGKSLW